MLFSIDSEAPLSGPARSGFLQVELDKALIKELLFLKSIDNKILIDDASLFEKIIAPIAPIVRNYLGAHACLDGVHWMVTNPKKNGFSGSWHTDNVGSRLKVFICLEGDGKCPTLLIPNTQSRNLNFFRKLFFRFIESIRWLGFDSKLNLKSVRCNHVAGSCFLFDTDVLHRGFYGVEAEQRVIFHLEFSDKRKLGLTNGPIGTLPYNEFYFVCGLLESNIISPFLDDKRITFLKDGLCMYKK